MNYEITEEPNLFGEVLYKLVDEHGFSVGQFPTRELAEGTQPFLNGAQVKCREELIKEETADRVADEAGLDRETRRTYFRKVCGVGA